MNNAFGQRALYGLLAVIIGVTGNGLAQDAGVMVTRQAPGCAGSVNCPDPQVTIAIPGPPPMIAGQVGVVSTGGMAFALQENAEAVKNQPYQAQAVTQIKQTLADGSHIAQTTTATVARDSDGRTARIQKLSTIGPWRSNSESSLGSDQTLTTIFDPVANTHTDYTSDMKVAHVLAMPPPPPSGASMRAAGGFAFLSGNPGGAGTGPVTFAVQGHSDSDHAANSPDVKTESLGTKAIDGIQATGTKVTNTIPAGTIGNDKDLVITRETWYSPDLKLVLQSTQTDPRFGQTTYSLTNIQRSEPDPSLFQVPAGYTIDKPSVHFQTR
ncbi:MAG TPA: hypothetical protein VGI45_10495 [Terracidiphilus sp.]|jgi:hypothetical protein